MLTIIGFVSLEPPAQEGTAASERVTMTSVGAAAQCGVTVRTEVGVEEESWLKEC